MISFFLLIEKFEFVVNNLFLRIASSTEIFSFKLELDKNLPTVQINEFVVWEIIQPLMQNSIDHGGENNIVIRCITKYDEVGNKSYIIIEDNGVGINKDLLNYNENGIKNLFIENVTSKESGLQNSGYGCYIAYQISKRCGWDIDAENLSEGGCRFTIVISN